MSLRALTTVQKRVPGFAPNIIFDVGANVGQTSADFAAHCPRATIHSFEPVASSYQALVKAVPATVHCHNIALGAEDGEVHFRSVAKSVTNHVIDDPAKTKHPVEIVRIRAGDSFCHEHGVPRIDYLKIDTEGHDLQVLVGFTSLLRRSAIAFLQVEAGMNSLNTRHVSLATMQGFLEPLGYHLHQISGQVQEKDSCVLRRCNAVFVSSTYK